MIQAFNNVAHQLEQAAKKATQAAAPAPPNGHHRRRLRNSLITIDGMFAAADQDIWLEETGNLRMGSLRRLVKDMLTDLDPIPFK